MGGKGKEVSKGNRRKWQGGQRDGNKKQRMSAASARGFPGIFITCDVIKERQAVKDALNVLNEYAEKLFPSESEKSNAKKSESKEGEENTESSSGADSAEKMLQKEIEELKKKGAEKPATGPFQVLDSGVKGSFLVRILDERIKPVPFVEAIFQDIEKRKESISRFIVRMIPLQTTCYPSMEEIKSAVEPLVKNVFGALDSSEKVSFAVDLKKRNCGNIKSLDAINACIDQIDPRHSVDLKSADYWFLVEIFKNVCGISIVKDLHRYKKFNMEQLAQSFITEPKENTQTESADKNAEDQTENQNAKSEE